MSEENPKTRKELIKAILYCVDGAMTDHNNRNYGDEERWYRHIYQHYSEYKDQSLDLKDFDIIEQEEKEERRKAEAQKETEEYCKRNGHKWYRHPYCGASDTNYLTCERCGAEERD